MRRVLPWSAAALFVAAGLSTATASGQDQIGGGSSRYEILYGEPEERSLDEDPASWPEGRSIRTVGYLDRRPQLQQQPTGDGQPRASPRTYSLHGQYSVTLYPVSEIANRFAIDAPSWLGREVEVVGAFQRKGAAAIGGGLAASRTLLVWSVLALEEREDDGFDAPRSGLDALVMDTDAAAGKVVTVTGTFRGANLLEDLPNDSRRHKDDWVLSDGPFSIWVTGKKPEGDGFSFDLRSRSDLRWELAVQGEVEVHDGYVYLQAEKIRLVGPARDEPE